MDEKTLVVLYDRAIKEANSEGISEELPEQKAFLEFKKREKVSMSECSEIYNRDRFGAYCKNLLANET